MRNRAFFASGLQFMLHHPGVFLQGPFFKGRFSGKGSFIMLVPYMGFQARDPSSCLSQIGSGKPGFHLQAAVVQSPTARFGSLYQRHHTV